MEAPLSLIRPLAMINALVIVLRPVVGLIDRLYANTELHHLFVGVLVGAAAAVVEYWKDLCILGGRLAAEV